MQPPLLPLQGKGIRLIQGGNEAALQRMLLEMGTPNIVVQQYLPKPFLISGYKFDLRIYALVLSCEPLRVYIYKEGLVRFCTEKYVGPKASNLDLAFMHLTNYAVNKHNVENFTANSNSSGGEQDTDASKWSLAQLQRHLAQQGHEWGPVWAAIGAVIIKSLIAVQPVLKHNYRAALPPDNDRRSCFELLGYDIMLDAQLRPWLIEVNHSPSFNIDSPLDRAIKEELITDTLTLVRVDPKGIKKSKKAEKRAAQERLMAPARRPTAGATSESGYGATATGRTRGGEGGSTPASAATEARAKAQRLMEKHEAKHAGGFQLIYPCPAGEQGQQQQALYEQLLARAAESFGSCVRQRSKGYVGNLIEARKQKEQASKAGATAAATAAGGTCSTSGRAAAATAGDGTGGSGIAALGDLRSRRASDVTLPGDVLDCAAIAGTDGLRCNLVSSESNMRLDPSGGSSTTAADGLSSGSAGRGGGGGGGSSRPCSRAQLRSSSCGRQTQRQAAPEPPAVSAAGIDTALRQQFDDLWAGAVERILQPLQRGAPSGHSSPVVPLYSRAATPVNRTRSLTKALPERPASACATAPRPATSSDPPATSARRSTVARDTQQRVRRLSLLDDYEVQLNSLLKVQSPGCSTAGSGGTSGNGGGHGCSGRSAPTGDREADSRSVSRCSSATLCRTADGAQACGKEAAFQLSSGPSRPGSCLRQVPSGLTGTSPQTLEAIYANRFGGSVQSRKKIIHSRTRRQGL